MTLEEFADAVRKNLDQFVEIHRDQMKEELHESDWYDLYDLHFDGHSARCKEAELSTYERKTPVLDKRIPEGCEVFFHEIRGYDSPDRWYTAWKGKRQLRDPQKNREFSRREAAITACVVDAAVGPRPWYDRLDET